VQHRRAFSSLRFTSVLALTLVYMGMPSQFKSLLDPFIIIIMFSVPMAMIGVIWALFLTNTALDATSFPGIIMMVGIVVSSGVLLVEYVNELRRHAHGPHEAAMRAGRTRLRPIVMTSLTAVVGPLPMAVGIDVGGEANAPLVRAAIGGLTVSTVLTLVFIPTLYVMLEERFPRRVTAPDSEPVLQGDPA
jgi:multidrug efflux pump subunit AcrB